MSTLSDAIYQNTPGNSQGSGLGLSWDKDTSSTPQTPPPAGWSSLTAWAQVYQDAGASVSPNNASDTVQVQDFQTYVLLPTEPGSLYKIRRRAASRAVITSPTSLMARLMPLRPT